MKDKLVLSLGTLICSTINNRSGGYGIAMRWQNDVTWYVFLDWLMYIS